MSADLEIIDKQKLTTLERLRLHLENPKKSVATQRDLDYLENLKAAFALFSKEYTKAGQINRVMELAGITTAIQAKNIIRDATDLFAPTLELTKSIELAFLYQHYARILQSLTFDEDDMGRAIRKTGREDLLAQAEILDKMAKLVKQLPDTKEQLPPPPKSFIFTTDVKALKGHG